MTMPEGSTPATFTRLIADAHVHLYPCYDVAGALAAGRARLLALAPGAAPAVFLAERHDCRFFAELAAGRIRLEGVGLEVRPSGDEYAVRLEPLSSAEPALTVFAGRQVVTAERVEILALTTDERIPDGLPAAETLDRVRAAGGLPVLSWAPGKWFFRREAVVRRLIEFARPGDLLLGDTSLRPLGWGEPRLMREGRRRGLPCVAGSDPLPFGGEERRVGTYASRLQGSFDIARPVASARALLRAPGAPPLTMGRRGGVATVLLRLYRNSRAKSPARVPTASRT